MNPTRILGIVVAALVTACGSGGGSAAVRDFVSTLNQAQEVPAPVLGVDVEVVITNVAPTNGTFQTPVWVGFHDGTFDIYESGTPAGAALERIAEDGNAGPLSDSFTAAAAGRIQSTVPGASGVIAPGETTRLTLRVDPNSAMSRYFSYTSMVIPSNDALVANGNPMSHQVFDGAGMLMFSPFLVMGGEVLDAGTEMNDEVPANTAFFGQAAPDTGVAENGDVGLHAGFQAPGGGGILDDAQFAAADFTADGYEALGFQIGIVNANPAAPMGTATVTVSEDGMSISYEITASGLSGAVTGAHIHQAVAGVAGSVVFDIGSTIVQNGDAITAMGTINVTPVQLAALRAGQFYFNVHTALNPSGELRGQIVAAP